MLSLPSRSVPATSMGSSSGGARIRHRRQLFVSPMFHVTYRLLARSSQTHSRVADFLAKPLSVEFGRLRSTIAQEGRTCAHPASRLYRFSQARSLAEACLLA